MDPLVPSTSFVFFSTSAGAEGGEPFNDLRGLLTGGVCVEGVQSDLGSPGVGTGDPETRLESFTGTMGRVILGEMTCGPVGRPTTGFTASTGFTAKGTSGSCLAGVFAGGETCDTGAVGTTAFPLELGEWTGLISSTGFFTCEEADPFWGTGEMGEDTPLATGGNAASVS
jgi:hypothetical protein